MLHASDGEGSWFRIVDVMAALGGRGYSSAGTVTLGVPEDDLAPWNEGSYRLTVDEEGMPHVERVRGEAEIMMSVKTLASAFTGARRVGELANWGLVAGDDRAIAVVDTMFATRFAPHTPDHF
ncbi:MAG: sterol carrier protein domain-containing protein [Pseudomonadales bacterium]|jgi:predicted acetyltransferase|nr:sterol carrier protein domain-containing protein [Pseudomonadales bacterium]MDP6472357.1 sterol carrier protein domain-containing protein [Pseudomonadales bacterium]MDP6828153.1 sterol carrier protein domain-containing protein [Pseudomonadales bacterium]MDP6973462.1 sterol carrier protein domain-containing protein [Pseudomonadales bacterium]|tara:strand:- start:1802 stop:2170 length:369 start_codon:yes stop_codon:yes gene_type:complete